MRLINYTLHLDGKLTRAEDGVYDDEELAEVRRAVAASLRRQEEIEAPGCEGYTLQAHLRACERDEDALIVVVQDAECGCPLSLGVSLRGDDPMRKRKEIIESLLSRNNTRAGRQTRNARARASRLAERVVCPCRISIETPHLWEDGPDAAEDVREINRLVAASGCLAPPKGWEP